MSDEHDARSEHASYTAADAAYERKQAERFRRMVAGEQALAEEVFDALRKHGEHELAGAWARARDDVFADAYGPWKGIVKPLRAEDVAIPPVPLIGLFPWELAPDAQYEIHTLHNTLMRFMNDERDARLLNDETDFERGAA